jgi:DNA replication protein DnaC
MNIDEFLRQSIQHNAEEAKRLMAEKKQQRVAEIMQNSGMKSRFKKRTFATFVVTTENTLAYQKALEFAENFEKQGKGLLFTGNIGTGKTHLAAAIANHLMQNLYTVVFGNVTDIISRIYDTYDKDSDVSTTEIIRYLTSVDLLIIDDLGKEYTSENVRTLLYQIINALYEDEKLVVITTNLSGRELSEKIGPATVSRITEMTEPIIMQGHDWRLRR